MEQQALLFGYASKVFSSFVKILNRVEGIVFNGNMSFYGRNILANSVLANHVLAYHVLANHVSVKKLKSM